MAYQMHRRTQVNVNRIIKETEQAKKAGHAIASKLVADGNGLYLQVPELSWISRLRFAKRRFKPGHGTARSVKLGCLEVQ